MPRPLIVTQGKVVRKKKPRVVIQTQQPAQMRTQKMSPEQPQREEVEQQLYPTLQTFQPTHPTNIQDTFDLGTLARDTRKQLFKQVMKSGIPGYVHGPNEWIPYLVGQMSGVHLPELHNVEQSPHYQQWKSDLEQWTEYGTKKLAFDPIKEKRREETQRYLNKVRKHGVPGGAPPNVQVRAPGGVVNLDDVQNLIHALENPPAARPGGLRPPTAAEVQRARERSILKYPGQEPIKPINPMPETKYEVPPAKTWGQLTKQGLAVATAAALQSAADTAVDIIPEYYGWGTHHPTIKAYCNGGKGMTRRRQW